MFFKKVQYRDHNLQLAGTSQPPICRLVAGQDQHVKAFCCHNDQLVAARFAASERKLCNRVFSINKTMKFLRK